MTWDFDNPTTVTTGEFSLDKKKSYSIMLTHNYETFLGKLMLFDSNFEEQEVISFDISNTFSNL